MNQIIDIFQDNSDKARLITALIATVSALFVVYLSNWLASRRDRSVIKIEKLEKAFASSLKLRIAINELVSVWERGKEEGTFFTVKEKYRSAMNEFEVYAHIYVPNIKKELDRLNSAVERFMAKDGYADGNRPLKIQGILQLCKTIENQILRQIKSHL